jgi:hypothetical protein
MTLSEKLETDVAEYVRAKLPPRARRLASFAKWSLYFGPFRTHCMFCEDDDCDGCAVDSKGLPHAHSMRWPGWSAAVDEIRAALDSASIGTLYYDDDCGQVMDTEPQGEEFEGDWMEPAPYYAIEPRDWKRYAFSELGEHL